MNIKSFAQKHFSKLGVVAVAVGIVAIGGAVSADAAVGDEGGIYHYHINDQVEADLMRTPAKSVWTESVNNGAIIESHLVGAVRAQLQYGKSGEKMVIEPKVVEKVGGSFTTNATVIGTFKLAKGSWLLPVSARFDRTATGPADGNRPQLAIRYNGTKDAATVMGQELSPLKGRELTGADNKVVVLDSETTFTVTGFGYNDDTSAAGGGTFTAGAEITPVRVG
jgi:hypothetical protein